jgi:hypothetical protein
MNGRNGPRPLRPRERPRMKKPCFAGPSPMARPGLEPGHHDFSRAVRTHAGSSRGGAARSSAKRSPSSGACIALARAASATGHIAQRGRERQHFDFTPRSRRAESARTPPPPDGAGDARRRSRRTRRRGPLRRAVCRCPRPARPAPRALPAPWPMIWWRTCLGLVCRVTSSQGIGAPWCSASAAIRRAPLPVRPGAASRWRRSRAVLG